MAYPIWVMLAIAAIAAMATVTGPSLAAFVTYRLNHPKVKHTENHPIQRRKMGKFWLFVRYGPALVSLVVSTITLLVEVHKLGHASITAYRVLLISMQVALCFFSISTMFTIAMIDILNEHSDGVHAANRVLFDSIIDLCRALSGVQKIGDVRDDA